MTTNSRRGQRPARDAALLAALAEALEPRRSPFYTAAAPGGQPAGWYMIHKTGEAQWLGRNYIWAERKLLELAGAAVGSGATGS